MSTPCLSEPPAPRTHQYCALIWDPSQKSHLLESPKDKREGCSSVSLPCARLGLW